MAFLLVGGLLALFGVGYVAMSRHVANAGAFYAYVAQGLGRPAGVGAAWVALAAYNLLQVGLYGVIGAAASPLLDQWFGVSLPWWVIALVAWAIVALLGLQQVDINGKVLAVLLCADLRGYGPDQPAPPDRILDGYLAALGIPPETAPHDVDAKAGLYRSLLHGRRVLVLLDNAASSQQVRPLMPGAPGCLAVVTGRSTLAGLVARDRAYRICLDVLPLEDAVALLAGFLGDARVAAEPATTAELAQLCACLPVALCAAGERGAARPHATLASLVKELTSADKRLNLLDAGDDRRTAVRDVFSWSY